MRNFLAICLIFGLMTLGCTTKRTNTEADREATYVEEGDTINPTEGMGEGTAGKKYMETTDSDSANIEQ